MSDLQLSLLGMGMLLVAGVWAYNKLQERKYRRSAEQMFPGDQPDVLAPAAPVVAADELPAWARTGAQERVEPAIEAAVAYAPPERIEPVFGEAVQVEPEPEPEIIADDPLPAAPAPSYEAPAYRSPAAPPAVPMGAPAEPPADWCSDSIDAVGRLEFSERVDPDDLRQAQGAMQRQQRVPVRAFVRDSAGRWLPLEDAGNDSVVGAWFAIQLVDRNGMVNAQDLIAFSQSLNALAKLRDGSLLFPDIAGLTEQGKALDDFCAQLDLQLALNVLDNSGGTFLGTKIRGLAEAAGMTLAPNGEFHARDDAGHFLFALANMGEAFDVQTMRSLQTGGLTFFLDVPHVADGGRAFENMLATARHFATALGGSLVNAQRVAVSGPMVDGIRTKIFEIQEQMSIAGIPAGGVRALRLFS